MKPDESSGMSNIRKYLAYFAVFGPRPIPNTVNLGLNPKKNHAAVGRGPIFGRKKEGPVGPSLEVSVIGCFG